MLSWLNLAKNKVTDHVMNPMKSKIHTTAVHFQEMFITGWIYSTESYVKYKYSKNAQQIKPDVEEKADSDTNVSREKLTSVEEDIYSDPTASTRTNPSPTANDTAIRTKPTTVTIVDSAPTSSTPHDLTTVMILMVDKSTPTTSTPTEQTTMKMDNSTLTDPTILLIDSSSPTCPTTTPEPTSCTSITKTDSNIMIDSSNPATSTDATDPTTSTLLQPATITESKKKFAFAVEEVEPVPAARQPTTISLPTIENSPPTPTASTSTITSRTTMSDPIISTAVIPPVTPAPTATSTAMTTTIPEVAEVPDSLKSDDKKLGSSLLNPTRSSVPAPVPRDAAGAPQCPAPTLCTPARPQCPKPSNSQTTPFSFYTSCPLDASCPLNTLDPPLAPCPATASHCPRPNPTDSTSGKTKATEDSLISDALNSGDKKMSPESACNVELERSSATSDIATAPEGCSEASPFGDTDTTTRVVSELIIVTAYPPEPSYEGKVEPLVYRLHGVGRSRVACPLYEAGIDIMSVSSSEVRNTLKIHQQKNAITKYSNLLDMEKAQSSKRATDSTGSREVQARPRRIRRRSPAVRTRPAPPLRRCRAAAHIARPAPAAHAARQERREPLSDPVSIEFVLEPSRNMSRFTQHSDIRLPKANYGERLLENREKTISSSVRWLFSRKPKSVEMDISTRSLKDSISELYSRSRSRSTTVIIERRKVSKTVATDYAAHR